MNHIAIHKRTEEINQCISEYFWYSATKGNIIFFDAYPNGDINLKN
jgi:CRISPR/Cas system CMR subunit Cmr6 (Cas7 group RAMP superfamily)